MRIKPKFGSSSITWLLNQEPILIADAQVEFNDLSNAQFNDGSFIEFGS